MNEMRNLETLTNISNVINEKARDFYEDRPHFYLAATVVTIYSVYLIKNLITE